MLSFESEHPDLSIVEIRLLRVHVKPDTRASKTKLVD